MSKARFHEWAWGYVTVRTVCGLISEPARRNAVFDLDNVAAADRCKNCDRMRAAIGTAARRRQKLEQA